MNPYHHEFCPTTPTTYEMRKFGEAIEDPELERLVWEGYGLGFRVYFPYEIPMPSMRPVIRVRSPRSKFEFKIRPWFYVLDTQADWVNAPEYSAVIYPQRIERSLVADALITDPNESKLAEVTRAIGHYLHLRQLRVEYPDVCIFGRPIGETGMTDIGDSLWFDATLLWKITRYRDKGGTEEVEPHF